MKNLEITHPLFVAPMAGGPTTPELIAAVSEAGALGSMGAAYMNAEAMIEYAQRVRELTTKKFAINLFIPHAQPMIGSEMLAKAVHATQKYRDELNLPEPKLVPPYEENFSEQFAAVLKIKPAALSFIFGLLPEKYMQAARAENILLIGTATSLKEALLLRDSKVDAIVLQGIESGGHRGIFDPTAQDPAISCTELLKQARSQIDLPLIAAGGIMTSADIKKMLSLGADAVQLGTAFLATKEAGTSEPYRKRLLESAERKTQTTRVFSGRLARGIVNRFMQEMTDPSAILPFPAQNKFTRDLRNASAKAGSSDFLSLWSGSGHGALWTGSARDLVTTLMKDL